MTDRPGRRALWLALLYAAVGVTWVLTTDQVVLWLAPADPLRLTRLQTLKEWAFLIATASFWYAVVRRELLAHEQAEARLRQEHRHLEAVAQLASALVQTVAVPQTLTAGLAALCAALGFEKGAVWVADPERGGLRLAAHYGPLTPEAVALLARLDLDLPLLTVQAFRRRQVQAVEDVARLPDYQQHPLARRLYDLERYRCLLAIPLVVGQEAVGVVTLVSASPRVFTPADLQSAQTLGRLFAVAIHQARLYEEAQRQTAALTEERRRRELFTAAIAHDLKNLLTPLVVGTQLLARWERLPPERRARLPQTILEQAQRLNRLVTDLLDVARIETGRFTVEPRPVDLVALARRVVEEQQATTARHGLRLVAPDRLEGVWDPDRLAQALTNLLSNAIKYSPQGGEVTICLRALDGQVEVCVSDQGIGLQPEEIELLFEPYRRLARAPQLRGLGLGLYITRAIIAAHGGTVWATSPGPNRGATFCFRLPRVAPGPTAGAQAPSQRSNQA